MSICICVLDGKKQCAQKESESDAHLKFYSLVIKSVSTSKIHPYESMLKEKQERCKMKEKDRKRRRTATMRRRNEKTNIYLVPSIYHAYDIRKMGWRFWCKLRHNHHHHRRCCCCYDCLCGTHFSSFSSQQQAHRLKYKIRSIHSFVPSLANDFCCRQ